MVNPIFIAFLYMISPTLSFLFGKLKISPPNVRPSSLTVANNHATVCGIGNNDYYRNDCVITVTAGTGGTESYDWCEILTRMYKKFITKYRSPQNGFGNFNFPESLAIRSIEQSVMDGGTGYKFAKIHVTGMYAYNLLRSENGTHRLVRNSPFNTQNKRMTSFAGVEVMPVLTDMDQGVMNANRHLEIKKSDLRIETMRSEGKGGQNVNKVETAVRITHLPSGIAVKCQQERTQERNKAIAMKELELKLVKLREEEIKHLENAIKGPRIIADWGRHIKSYILSPQARFKDHRIGYQSSNVQSVLDGDLLPCILAYHQANLAD